MPTLIREVYGKCPYDVINNIETFVLERKIDGEQWKSLTGVLEIQPIEVDDGEETTVAESQFVCILVRIS
jgi:hypothetical protein